MKFKHLVSRFAANNRGQFAVAFSLLIVPVMAIVGASIDYSRVWGLDSRLQQALDAAALAAAAAHDQTETARATLGNDIFLANAGNPCTNPAKISFSGSQTTASSTCTIPTSFLGLLGISELPVTGSATAEIVPDGNGMPMCVLALDPAMKKAVEGSGGTEWQAKNCLVHVNSSNAKSVNLSGGSSITSAENCFVGGVDQGLSRVSPPPESTCDPINDPFAALPKPAVASCDHNKFSLNKDATINPGVYCDGLELKDATFHLNPGLYIIKDGEFRSSGTATIKGNGVTIFITGEDTGVTWSGGGTYQLTAMSTGPLASFVIYLDPDGEQNKKSHISGGGDTYYEGILYFPKQKLEISGTGSVSTVSPFTALVANNFLFSGGSQLNIEVDPGNTALPIPPSLYKSTGGKPRLVN